MDAFNSKYIQNGEIGVDTVVGLLSSGTLVSDTVEVCDI